MPEELQQPKLEAAVNYEEKLTDHIKHIIKLNKLAIEKNQQYQDKMKRWFDRKKVRNTEIIFKVGDIVMYNISSRIKTIKIGTKKWVGPYVITRERDGPLYDLEYINPDNSQKFFRIHPEFLRLYEGQIS